jgi:LmbE family N-acetylglucosaminyl deacetylase
MKTSSLLTSVVLMVFGLTALCGGRTQAAEPAPLRIICFGAHPDDCEIQAGGTAMLWAAKKHKVKFVSVTNGDIGHWREAGGPLARRRKAEVEAADKILGATTEVLDIHDGELLPTLENRRLLTKLIREWQADIVIGPRPNDYHPDHRYTAVLVQDAAYMVTVPHFCPDVPALKKNPYFFYSPDRFKKPNPFKPDVVIDIGQVLDQKLDALGAITSQFYEGGANGYPELMPTDPEKQKARHQQVRDSFTKRQADLTERFRTELATWYGAGPAQNIKYVEAFEVCEYGNQPTTKEMKQLFPFFGE